MLLVSGSLHTGQISLTSSKAPVRFRDKISETFGGFQPLDSIPSLMLTNYNHFHSTNLFIYEQSLVSVFSFQEKFLESRIYFYFVIFSDIFRGVAFPITLKKKENSFPFYGKVCFTSCGGIQMENSDLNYFSW